jgi:putative protein-disulfide isomerase
MDEEYKEQAYSEFALCKQLNVAGFPSIFIQLEERKFHQVAQGYTEFETLDERIKIILKDLMLN